MLGTGIEEEMRMQLSPLLLRNYSYYRGVAVYPEVTGHFRPSELRIEWHVHTGT